jgi:hypothetical protein
VERAGSHGGRARGVRQRHRRRHLAGSAATVDGVGDAAAFDVSDALVFERHGAYWVVQVLNMGGVSDVRSKDAEVELATLVVDKIGWAPVTSADPAPSLAR